MCRRCSRHGAPRPPMPEASSTTPLPRSASPLSGAAPLSEDLASRVTERFGVDLHEGYGLTEASPVVTTGGVGSPSRPGSVGPPIPGVEVRLVDGDGRDVLLGDPGEIWVRGPNIFAGYWRDPDTTAQVLTDDGWLRTGDVAVADADGWLSIVNRIKDLIIVSGFNVYPAEIEEVLAENDDVSEAAVIGVPDARTGEAIVAFVVPADGAHPSAEELREFTAARIARYKVPSRVEVVDDLPRTMAGKVLRRALRDLVSSGSPGSPGSPGEPATGKPA
ncbi:MAG: AMP-binding protein [Acidimicrobiia bacterium]|nr:AMP-binding protein [Acidimicrobiia bacterium]